MEKNKSAFPTPLAVDIRTADEKARYDASVKKILADRRILAWILQECVEEFRDVPIEDIVR